MDQHGNTGLAVIGAGLGRTGTTTLEVALAQLGLRPCYTMTALFKHPDHLPLWRAAARGERVDWDRIFAGYRVTMESPGCTFYRQLMAAYPDAKVILTTRDPDRWYESVKQTLYRRYRIMSSPLGSAALLLSPRRRRAGQASREFIWQGFFQGQFTDRERSIARFRQHNAEVEATVPPDRLLVFDVAQGWEPLCSFLGVPVPADRPFPHVNTGAYFQKKMRRRLAGFIIALLACIALVVRARRRSGR